MFIGEKMKSVQYLPKSGCYFMEINPASLIIFDLKAQVLL